jgi:hypothetical protein
LLSPQPPERRLPLVWFWRMQDNIKT